MSFWMPLQEVRRIGEQGASRAVCREARQPEQDRFEEKSFQDRHPEAHGV
jgi:hypothetical protein